MQRIRILYRCVVCMHSVLCTYVLCPTTGPVHFREDSGEPRALRLLRDERQAPDRPRHRGPNPYT